MAKGYRWRFKGKFISEDKAYSLLNLKFVSKLVKFEKLKTKYSARYKGKFVTAKKAKQLLKKPKQAKFVKVEYKRIGQKTVHRFKPKPKPISKPKPIRRAKPSGAEIVRKAFAPRKSFVKKAVSVLRKAGFSEEMIRSRLAVWPESTESAIQAELATMIDMGPGMVAEAARSKQYMGIGDSVDLEKEPKYVKFRKKGKRGKYIKQTMKLRNLHIVMARPATGAERREMRYYQNLFDMMYPIERKANRIYRPQDLVAEGNVLRNMIHWQHPNPRIVPMINENFKMKAPPLRGEAGDNMRYFASAVELIEKNRKANHETYYISGEYGPSADPQFRTLTPRTILPVRDIRHRKPK